MKLAPKTALGIDIADNRISLALLRATKNGVELLKAADAAVPEGAIKDGCIEDPAALSHVIREVKTRSKIGWTHNAVVSLMANPVVLQITDLPKHLPANIGQHVQNEVKHCVALAGKTISLDFCRVGSAKGAGSKLLVVATDEQKVAVLAEACAQAGLNVGAIEPPILAYIRALHAKYIESKSDCNVLLAVLRHGILTTCVFRKRTLDFIRTRNISETQAEPREVCTWLAEQINAVIRFYDVEISDNREKWEVTVVPDSVALPDDAQESLKAETADACLKVITGEHLWQDSPVAQSGPAERPSAVAIGLALRLLDADGGNLKVNLAPPESTEVRSVKKHLLVTANIIAALLLVMILAAGVVGLATDRVNQRITEKKQTVLSRTTYTLLREQESLERQVKQLADRPERLNNILGSRISVNWAGILADIGHRTPETLRITWLQSKKDSGLYLEGVSLSYEAVRLFVSLLNESDYLESATANQAKKDDALDGMVRYSINCSLTRRNKANAD
ncbi:MAG: pilus assembly protein PilM [Planctomycetota bacterium]|jgi:Tfp pilus assembly PilM family ATPase/Tfp pilus assembly protein PilN